MCALDKMISCEIAFTPLGKPDYAADVDRVLHIIEASGMDFEVGAFATVVRGAKDGIFGLLRNIYDAMEAGSGFILDVKISNVCGCGANSCKANKP